MIAPVTLVIVEEPSRPPITLDKLIQLMKDGKAMIEVDGVSGSLTNLKAAVSFR